ncbi:hypothetical protein BKA59DRAFT_56667 [Fusarium tricinctum]|uniref:Uncharacterized protein n=1 Tax=Fusarium tricinctum TaxID=61284 RepID=A0A8K0S9U9_9HYPO|nr:hypothetical protein BKA59DRAFT_56667 [Fusarium tricinctum]
MVLGMALAHRLIRHRANPLASAVCALALWYSLPLTLTIIIPSLLRQDAETRRWFARAWPQRILFLFHPDQGPGSRCQTPTLPNPRGSPVDHITTHARRILAVRRFVVAHSWPLLKVES